jgi:effector-binding domain-containing protein
MEAGDYTIEVKTLPPQPVVGIRTVTPVTRIGATLAEVLNEVMEYLEAQGVEPAGPPYNRYHGTSDEGIAMEAGFPVARALPGTERVLAGELPGGEVAVTWHMGPYAKLRDAYRALGLWLKANGREMAGSPWELYWTDPGEIGHPGLWKTEIYWPIGPPGG